jgi:hypothetical protein
MWWLGQSKSHLSLVANGYTTIVCAGEHRWGSMLVNHRQDGKHCSEKMAVNQPFPRGTFKVEPGPRKNEVSVIFKPTQSTIVYSITRAGELAPEYRACITQEPAALVGLVKRKLRKPDASWQWRLPKRPGRDNDRQEGRAGLACCPPTPRCRGSLLRMVSRLSGRYRDPPLLSYFCEDAIAAHQAREIGN